MGRCSWVHHGETVRVVLLMSENGIKYHLKIDLLKILPWRAEDSGEFGTRDIWRQGNRGVYVPCQGFCTSVAGWGKLCPFVTQEKSRHKKDPRMIVSAGNDGFVRIINSETSEILGATQLQQNDKVRAITWCGASRPDLFAIQYFQHPTEFESIESGSEGSNVRRTDVALVPAWVSAAPVGASFAKGGRMATHYRQAHATNDRNLQILWTFLAALSNKQGRQEYVKILGFGKNERMSPDTRASRRSTASHEVTQLTDLMSSMNYASHKDAHSVSDDDSSTADDVFARQPDLDWSQLHANAWSMLDSLIENEDEDVVNELLAQKNYEVAFMFARNNSKLMHLVTSAYISGEESVHAAFAAVLAHDVGLLLKANRSYPLASVVAASRFVCNLWWGTAYDEKGAGKSSIEARFGHQQCSACSAFSAPPSGIHSDASAQLVKLTSRFRPTAAAFGPSQPLRRPLGHLPDGKSHGWNDPPPLAARKATPPVAPVFEVNWKPLEPAPVTLPNALPGVVSGVPQRPQSNQAIMDRLQQLVDAILSVNRSPVALHKIDEAKTRFGCELAPRLASGKLSLTIRQLLWQCTEHSSRGNYREAVVTCGQMVSAFLPALKSLFSLAQSTFSR
ncbi:unnamed protein product [Nippostrongylus brasiliensis]|uniref:WD_REPEATS_REGION domain-containing protein n=1 Tax=Nippostrongylus brasiliensis TaxID=27835 RepID=A0A158QWY5_NIPBR|nr:unnamed protein product [Nippostrongylus brasiliensis]